MISVILPEILSSDLCALGIRPTRAPKMKAVGVEKEENTLIRRGEATQNTIVVLKMFSHSSESFFIATSGFYLWADLEGIVSVEEKSLSTMSAKSRKKKPEPVLLLSFTP